MSVFSRLIPTLGTAVGLQLALASVFVPLKTEKYYDLGGALGFISSAAVSLYYPYILRSGSLPTLAPRQILVTGALCLWAARLGSFLFARAIKHGGDSRFDGIRDKPGVFFGYWFGQAVWVAVVGLPVYLVNALPAAAHCPLGPLDYAGFAIFAGSMAFEMVADDQKKTWRRDKDEKKHAERWIQTGLWSLSRHPNYVGEVGIQAGIWLMASSATIFNGGTGTPASMLIPRALGFASVLSPVFIYLLLTKASGVPPLERAGDKKFGGDPKYEEYKRRTPIFFPWGPAGDFRG